MAKYGKAVTINGMLWHRNNDTGKMEQLTRPKARKKRNVATEFKNTENLIAAELARKKKFSPK
jgi:hypothetical protein